MITDRELDVQLADAARVDDADLPALPEDFLGLLKTGTQGATANADGSELASASATRHLVADARDTRTEPRPRRGRTRQKALVRISTAVIAVAAAWATAVVATSSDRTATPDDIVASSDPVDPPVNGIRLVAAEEVTFPLSLDPAPEGLTPVFSRWGGVPYYGDTPLVFTADYSSADGDRVLIMLFPEDPRGLPDDSGWSVQGEAAGTATVDGAEAEVTLGDSLATVLWERPDGRWVWILGEGAYDETAAITAVAETVVGRPQPVGLQFGLAPAGWSLGGYEESRSLDLVSDTDPDQPPLRLSLIGPQGGVTIDTLFEGRVFAGPVKAVTIKGLPARMALEDGGEGSPDTWLVVGQLPDGPLFLLLAPPILTREQVLEMAEQITYTP